METNYNAFLDSLGIREFSGNYRAENLLGYIGKYQFGEAMLSDLGYYNLEDDLTGYLKNDWLGTWTGKNEVNSKEDFLRSPIAQENAIRAEMKLNWIRIKHFRLENHIGQIIDGLKVTESGMLAGAHLKGVGGLKKFLETKENVHDALVRRYWII